MNYRDKLQKFSIRKYTVGTFSTVIATLVFLGFNTSQAQAEEQQVSNEGIHSAATNKDEDDTKINEKHNDAQQSNVQAEKELANTSEENTNTETSANANDKQVSTVKVADTDNKAQQQSANAVKAENQKIADKDKQASAADTKETATDEVLADKPQFKLTEQSESNNNEHAQNNTHDNEQSTQYNKQSLQAFFDASYHDYRFIDRDKADKAEFNHVKAIFDKINTMLGTDDEPDSKSLEFAYKELQQAVAMIRTMPQREVTKKGEKHHIEERSSNQRSGSAFQSADSAYYVSTKNDGSGYPVGTYVSASNRTSIVGVGTNQWNRLKAADAKEVALITAKRVQDGYQWTIKFNKGHWEHQSMIYWFALPQGQTPVGITHFTMLTRQGTNSYASAGAGAGSGKPLPEMWKFGEAMDSSRARNFVQGPINGFTFYNWPQVHINSFRDMARAGDYFNEDGASTASKNGGRDLFRQLNGELPNEIPGLDKIYAFVGEGDSSYTISFKTTGPTNELLYYAAGGRAFEYGQLYNYTQLYVENKGDFQRRIQSIREVVNRTMHLGNAKNVYNPYYGRNDYEYLLDNEDGSQSDDFATNVFNYIKNPSPEVLGFVNPNLDYNHYRHTGVNPLNEYEIKQLLSEDKLREAARTGRPIRLMIAFLVDDRYGNHETLVPVNLTVKPEIQYNISFYSNDEQVKRGLLPISVTAGHPVFTVHEGTMRNDYIDPKGIGAVAVAQQLRIKLDSNEPFDDTKWEISGFPSSLHIEDASHRTNNNREKNLELVGQIAPGIYFGNVRFGHKEQIFEIRVKPRPPRIITTADELFGKGGTRPSIVIDNVPTDRRALVYLVNTGSLGRDGDSNPQSVPQNYNILATGHPDGINTRMTIQPSEYIQDLPVNGQIKALVYYSKDVQSNFSNSVEVATDVTPPVFGQVQGLKAKYYNGDELVLTIPISDGVRGTGVRRIEVFGKLDSTWQDSILRGTNGADDTIILNGIIPNNIRPNSTRVLRIEAIDNNGNRTPTSQAVNIIIRTGQINRDFEPAGLSGNEKVTVVNPTNVSNEEKAKIIEAIKRKNSSIVKYFDTNNPIVVSADGSVVVNYKDNTHDSLPRTSVISYSPVLKPKYFDGIEDRQITINLTKGQRYDIAQDLRDYFQLSDGSEIPKEEFTNMRATRTLPSADRISKLDAGTYMYRIEANNVFKEDIANLTINFNVVELAQPTGDDRVFRLSPYKLTDDEVSKVKQAFI